MNVMKQRKENLFAIIFVIFIIIANSSMASKAKEARVQFLNYDNPLLGVKFSYPDSWHFNSGLYGYEPSCSGRDKVPGTERYVDPGNMYCSFKLKPDSSYATLDIKAIRGQYYDSCKCNNLTEFAKWHYNNIRSGLINFINDSKIILSGNIPAWKIEYSSSDPVPVTTSAYAPFNHTDILAIVNGTYYTISYSGNAEPLLLSQKSDYSTFLPLANEMINSIQFIPIRPITPSEIPSYVPAPPKKPSFMQP